MVVLDGYVFLLYHILSLGVYLPPAFFIFRNLTGGFRLAEWTQTIRTLVVHGGIDRCDDLHNGLLRYMLV